METLTKNLSISIPGTMPLMTGSTLQMDNNQTDTNDARDKKRPQKKPKLKVEESNITTDDIKQLSSMFIAQQKENDEHVELEGDGGEGDSAEQLKKDKLLVYSHPLFPLLALIFEKCELATHSLTAFETDSSLKCCDAEIVSFIEQHQKSGVALFTDRPEVDSLVSVPYNCSHKSHASHFSTDDSFYSSLSYPPSGVGESVRLVH